MRSARRQRRAFRRLAAALTGGPVWSATPSLPLEVLCPRCGGDHVAPVEWEPADDAHWRIRCRCGLCDSWHQVVVRDAVASVLDCRLDEQQQAIRRAADRLEHSRMAAQIDAFVAALQRDLIDAADFAR